MKVKNISLRNYSSSEISNCKFQLVQNSTVVMSSTFVVTIYGPRPILNLLFILTSRTFISRSWSANYRSLRRWKILLRKWMVCYRYKKNEGKFKIRCLEKHLIFSFLLLSPMFSLARIFVLRLFIILAMEFEIYCAIFVPSRFCVWIYLTLNERHFYGCYFAWYIIVNNKSISECASYLFVVLWVVFLVYLLFSIFPLSFVSSIHWHSSQPFF